MTVPLSEPSDKSSDQPRPFHSLPLHMPLLVINSCSSPCIWPSSTFDPATCPPRCRQVFAHDADMQLTSDSATNAPLQHGAKVDNELQYGPNRVDVGRLRSRVQHCRPSAVDEPEYQVAENLPPLPGRPSRRFRCPSNETSITGDWFCRFAYLPLPLSEIRRQTSSCLG